MKKLITALATALLAFPTLAQTYPSPTFNSLTLQNPLTPENGGTGASTSTGTGSVVLSSSPALTTPTIASPTFTGSFTATGLVTISALAAQAANSVIANATGSNASPTAFAMPSCSTSTSALQWTSGTGFTCYTNSASLTGATFTGAISAQGVTTTTFAAATSATAPTPTAGDNSTKVATTAFLASKGFAYQQSNIIAIAANTTLTTSQLGGTAQFQANAAIATLPALSGVTFGSTMTFMGGVTGGTIKGNAAEVIINAASTSANTLYVPPGQTVTVVSNGSGNGWYVTSTGKGIVPSNCQNVADFGGDNTGVRDNSTAATAAIAASPTSKACIYFGPGLWKFTSQITYSFPASAGSISILGAGADTTELQFASGINGIALSLQGSSSSSGTATSFHIRNLALTTTGAGAGGAAIVAAQLTGTIPNPAPTALSDITDVTIRGSDGYFQSNYWSNAIVLNQVSNVNFRGMNIIGSTAQLGAGVTINSTSTAPGVQYNFSESNFYSMASGLILGTYTQGVTVSQCNFTAQSYSGIYVPAGETGMDQLTIVNSQFASLVGIRILSQYQNLMVAHNLFIIFNTAGNVGIYNSAAVLFSYIGNTFQNVNAPTQGSAQGIYVNNTFGVGGVISGNVFRYMAPAIYLDTAASGVNVQSNSYFNNNTNVSNNGSGNCLGSVCNSD
ncbi:UNVERIFIED_ORG: hypothetical protein ABIC54_004506 [Burkholderia sp. 1263]